MKNHFFSLFKHKIGEESKKILKRYQTPILMIVCALLSPWAGAWFVLSNTVDVEKKNKEQTEKKLVEKIEKEIKTSLEKINNKHLKQDSVICESSKLIQYAEEKQYNINKDTLASMLRFAISFYDIQPIYVNYEELDINIIDDIDLKMKLLVYGNQIKFGFEDHNYSIEVSLKMIDLVDEFFADYLNFNYSEKRLKYLKEVQDNKKYETDLKNLLNNKKFLGLLKIKTSLETNRYDYQEKVIESMKDILSAIDNFNKNNSKK